MIPKKTKLGSWRKQMSGDICRFLEREDNSPILTGKADAVKVKDQKDKKPEASFKRFHVQLISETQNRACSKNFSDNIS